jgi:hypothetical protein
MEQATNLFNSLIQSDFSVTTLRHWPGVFHSIGGALPS